MRLVNRTSHERLDYPTQKPENLLERIITMSTGEGDLIADFFCGSDYSFCCGEAEQKWIGSDLESLNTHEEATYRRQRELKKAGKISVLLRFGMLVDMKENFLAVNDDLRAEEKAKQAVRRKEFVSSHFGVWAEQ